MKVHKKLLVHEKFMKVTSLQILCTSYHNLKRPEKGIDPNYCTIVDLGRGRKDNHNHIITERWLCLLADFQNTSHSS